MTHERKGFQSALLAVLLLVSNKGAAKWHAGSRRLYHDNHCYGIDLQALLYATDQGVDHLLMYLGEVQSDARVLYA